MHVEDVLVDRNDIPILIFIKLKKDSKLSLLKIVYYLINL